jgi:hypothetical protein
MGKYELSRGDGRTRVNLVASDMGDDLIVSIHNENGHLGAVAVGEYDHENERASVSVITRLGHKDDAVAQKAAYSISKSTKRPVCVIAGIHLENITGEEIDKILENSRMAVEELLKSLEGRGL